MQGRVDLVGLVTYQGGRPAQRRSPIPLLTGLSVEQLRSCWTAAVVAVQGSPITVWTRHSTRPVQKVASFWSPRLVSAACVPAGASAARSTSAATRTSSHSSTSSAPPGRAVTSACEISRQISRDRECSRSRGWGRVHVTGSRKISWARGEISRYLAVTSAYEISLTYIRVNATSCPTWRQATSVLKVYAAPWYAVARNMSWLCVRLSVCLPIHLHIN